MDKKIYPGKLAESDVVYIQIGDPRKIVVNSVIHKISTENQLKIPVVFDYTEFTPNYNKNNDWWYYDQSTNIVHVMFSEKSRSEFINLMKIEEKGNLTEEESKELSTYEAIINTIPYVAANKAVREYSNDIYKALENSFVAEETPSYGTKKEPEKKSYRTKAKATESINNLPPNLAIITNEQYRDSLSLKQGGGAYLQPLASTDGLMFDGKNLSFQGFPASEATLREINKDKNVEIDSIDLPLLRTFYSIILTDFETNTKKFGVVNEVVTVYVPDLASLLGKKRNISKNDIKTIIEKTSSFQTIYGILKDPNRPNGIGTAVPLLVWLGYKEETNTIQFASPYMTELIRRIYNVSIRKNKKGLPKLKKDGSPLLEASHSYLIKSSIVKERNKKAVEIVIAVVTTIEQAGNNTPHLKAKTIIKRIPQLQKAYNKATTTSNKNTVLSRSFKKAWELLETQTNLREKYPTIILPDPQNPKNIPTSSNLDMVFEFPHK